jgi:hypothetical protein
VEAKAALDSDGDGIPDAWELKHHLNPYNAADALVIDAKTGYSNLDLYLNELADQPVRQCAASRELFPGAVCPAIELRIVCGRTALLEQPPNDGPYEQYHRKVALRQHSARRILELRAQENDPQCRSSRLAS